MDRRSFLASLAAVTASLTVSETIFPGSSSDVNDRMGEVLPRRKLGNTGEYVTMMGLGGWHVGRLPEKEIQPVIETAIEQGIRFFDTAEHYQDGRSEERLGKYLTPKYRDIIFLMTKTRSYDAKTTREHLEGSLRRLNTDHLDLWQIHSLWSEEDVANRIKNGVFDVVMEAKATGKVRHIGFTGHHTYKSHLKVLEQYTEFETCQMPVNPIDINNESFVGNVLPKLVERKMGVLAMKTLANGRFFRKIEEQGNDQVIPNHISLRDALYFAWSLPISVLINGPDNADQLRENAGLAKKFVTLSEEERMNIIEKVAGFAGGEVEYYKA